MLTIEDRDRWIWPFELVDKIGEGGMGIVYRARYVVNDRQVAVKLLPTDVTDEVILARFERELEILKTLKHPNIVRCFGGVCENKRRFYAMELVEGGTLDGLLEQYGKLPWPKVAEYGLQMCGALAYSHERGVVHRDIKPGNFLIAANGQLKLSDFGLASVIASRKITAAGKTMGTYRYMAPEQIRGKTEIKSDLYALGCVLFEMLTGRPPFDGETPAEILQKHMREPAPRVREFALDCPPALESIVLDLLEKDPDRRPASAEEVARRLENVSEPEIVERPRTATATATVPSHRPVAVPPKTERKPLPKRVHQPAATSTLTAAVLLAAGMLLVWALWLHRQNSTLARAERLWIEAYRSDSREVQTAAAQALGELGTPAAVDALLEGLETRERPVRRAAAAALGETGAAGSSALPKLRRLQQQDEFPEVRTSAGESVKALQNAGGGGAFWFYTLLLLILAGSAGGAAYIYFSSREPEPDDD
jgi:serine/threonine-protein kinase